MTPGYELGTKRSVQGCLTLSAQKVKFIGYIALKIGVLRYATAFLQ